MRPWLFLSATLACLPGGCGTIHNLKAPPQPCLPAMYPTTCFPFGGVTRSAMLGYAGTVIGGFSVGGAVVTMKSEEILPAAGLMGLGLGALVDTPLSLVGDIVTLPIAYARSKGARWATWWGETCTCPETPASTNTITENFQTTEPQQVEHSP